MSESGFLGGYFYSFGLLSVFKEIKARLMKCFGRGLEFKILKGPEWTLIRKKKITDPFGPGALPRSPKRPGVSLPAPQKHKDVFPKGSG